MRTCILTPALLALSLLSLPAFAGSQSRDCQTADKSIVMGAGNSTNTIQINYVDADGKAAQYAGPVKIMPGFSYNSEENEKTVTAIPVSAERVLSKNHETMHVVHKNGTQCDGRERWDDRSVQTYVLTGKDGDTIRFDRTPKKIGGMIPDGYIVVAMQCRDYGITTAGGCFAEEGDKVTWVKSKD